MVNIFFVVWQNACTGTDKCMLWPNKQRPWLIWTKVLCFIFSGFFANYMYREVYSKAPTLKTGFHRLSAFWKQLVADLHTELVFTSESLKEDLHSVGSSKEWSTICFFLQWNLVMNTNQMWNFCPRGSFSILVSFSCKELDNKLKTQTVSKGKCWVLCGNKGQSFFMRKIGQNCESWCPQRLWLRTGPRRVQCHGQ